MIKLRPYQAEGIERFLKAPFPRRYLFAWEMSAGKTLAAITLADHLAVCTASQTRTLIVAPAIARPVWAAEFAKWIPDATIGLITSSRTSKPRNATYAVRREQAYAAPIQIVSYDLVHAVDPTGWDFIILDEVHNLRDPSSRQSKTIKALLTNNPEAAALGLSGTLIPNEAQQLWNVLDTFYPGQWGNYWDFRFRYCEHEKTQYGVRFWGLREKMRPVLAEELKPFMHRVIQADFAKYLPPLFVEPLYIDQTPRAYPLEKVVKDWLPSVAEVTHIGLFTHLRETAHELVRIVGHLTQRPTFCITGEQSPESRTRTLKAAREAENAILIGTTHALRESVSLSFLHAALVTEWVTSMDQVLQFIGRFARQDSTSMAPTRVQFLVRPDDTSRMDVLRARVEVANSVYKAGRAESLAVDTFADRQMTDAEFTAAFEQLLAAETKRAGLWSENDDTDEGDEDVA